MSDGQSQVAAEKNPIGIPESGVEKINVDSLRLLDKLVFQTAKNTYALTVGKDLHGILSSTNPSAKVGQIFLRGGTNADITEYTPNRIFIGGRLAYAFEKDTPELITTSVIESIAYEPGPR